MNVVVRACVVVRCCSADHKVMCVHFGTWAVCRLNDWLLLLLVTRDIINVSRLRVMWLVYKYAVRTAQWTRTVSVTETNQWMYYYKISGVCSEIHTKDMNVFLLGRMWNCLMLNLIVHAVTAGLRERLTRIWWILILHIAWTSVTGVVLFI